MIYDDFPAGITCPVVAADTETHTYVNGKLLSEQTLEKWSVRHTPAEIRQAVSVDVYAWQISDGVHCAICETFDEFCAKIAEIEARAVWWYNARFDFANVDAYVLNRPDEWKRKPKGKKATGKTFESLQGETGQRYCYALSYPRRARNRHVQTFSFKMYDFCNVLPGGLANVLKDLDVKDYAGKPIRRLTMDYQAAEITPEAVRYMFVDVLGLFHAVRLFGEFAESRFGIKIFGEKPDAFTAGGIAKRVLLSFIEDAPDHKARVKMYQRSHPITPAEDAEYRRGGLYRGGVSLVNPRYKGVVLRSKGRKMYAGRKRLKECGTLWRGDVNSMHPAQMHKGLDIYGFPERTPGDEWKRPRDNHVYILHVKTARGRVKPGKLPFWYDTLTGEYQANVDYFGEGFYIFAEEFAALLDWYDLDYTVDFCIAYRTRSLPGLAKFVDVGYEIKNEGKRTKNGVMKAFGKLMLNSSYGKFGENPIKIESEYSLNEYGAATLDTIGETIDEKSMLSVVFASWITSQSRLSLMRYADAVSDGKPGVYVIYVDTDSLHTFAALWNGCDDYAIGGLKNETPEGMTACVYLAPKTYVDFVIEEGNVAPEFHAKGVNIKAIAAKFAGKTEAQILSAYKPGLRVASLGGMNVRGGKALVKQYKYVARPGSLITSNAGGEIEYFFDA